MQAQKKERQHRKILRAFSAKGDKAFGLCQMQRMLTVLFAVKYTCYNQNMTFIKGQPSANPKGRPIGSISLVDILKRKLGSVPPGTSNTVAEQIVDAYLADVMTNPNLKRDVFDRIDGKPQQNLGVGGLDGEPLTVRVVHE